MAKKPTSKQKVRAKYPTAAVIKETISCWGVAIGGSSPIRWLSYGCATHWLAWRAAAKNIDSSSTRTSEAQPLPSGACKHGSTSVVCSYCDAETIERESKERRITQWQLLRAMHFLGLDSHYTPTPYRKLAELVQHVFEKACEMEPHEQSEAKPLPSGGPTNSQAE